MTTRKRRILRTGRGLVFAAALAVASVALAAPASAMDCVAYARAETGFVLVGDAWRWWDLAASTYARGHWPVPGAVIVFARTRAMRYGHVAVVRALRGPREILIDQANWQTGKQRGKIEVAVSAIDVSLNNDWSDVRVEWQRTRSYGRVNPVLGFIYPDKIYLLRPAHSIMSPARERFMADERWQRRALPRG
jgi:hypothetical protein